MILLVKLLLSHLLGDFVLQPKNWVNHKEIYKHKSIYLYVHSALHGILAFVLIGDFNFWLPAVVLAVAHLAIDWSKLHFQNNSNRRKWFVADQLLHLLALVLLALYMQGFLYFNAPNDQFWVVFTAILLLTTPTSISIKNLISGWSSEPDPEEQSLHNAGNYIGILERLFVFGFIMTGHFDAVGFLLGAKSIFRFGDLTGAKDRKLTEYVLIGTLLSFGIAILTGFLAQYVISILP